MNIPVWGLPAFSDLHFFQFGDQVVVYEGGSGDTHEVDPIAEKVLRLLSRRPHNSLELKQGILEFFRGLGDTETDTYLDDLLPALARKYLIRQLHL